MKKDMYVSPLVEVIEVENEGVIAGSGSVNGMGNNTWAPKRSGYNSSNVNTDNLEDIINDILTTENK